MCGLGGKYHSKLKKLSGIRPYNSANWRNKTKSRTQIRVVHLDIEDCSEELLLKQSYAIKNQLGLWGYFAFQITGPLRAWKPTILDIEVDQSALNLHCPSWFSMKIFYDYEAPTQRE